MPIDLLFTNVVVLARQFNPSILADGWLLRHRIVEVEGEFVQPRFYTPSAVQVATDAFDLVALPDRIQASPKGEQNAERMIDRLCRLITALPETPYTAIGLNFHWVVTSERATAQELSRTRFALPDSPFATAIQSDETFFGALAFRPFREGRMAIDIRSGTAVDEVVLNENSLLAKFNFHWPVANQDVAVELITHACQQREAARAESERIANSLIQ